jgi:hypothetical protein
MDVAPPGSPRQVHITNNIYIFPPSRETRRHTIRRIYDGLSGFQDLLESLAIEQRDQHSIIGHLGFRGSTETWLDYLLRIGIDDSLIPVILDAIGDLEANVRNL